MAVELASAMDTGELKKLLMKSKKEPVNCAVGMGDGKKTELGLILLDRVKAPKAVLKDLEKQFPDAANTRWGTAFVDTDADAALVQLRLNKAASGIGKKLVKSLKGTGFTKVKITLEDGSVVPDEEDDDEQTAVAPAGAAPNGATDAAQASDTSAPQAAAGSGSTTTPDVAVPTRALTDLVKRLAHADPETLASLKGMAVQAQDLIKSGDIARATELIGELREALDSAGKLPARQGKFRPDPAKAAAFVKARTAWLATRTKVESDIGALQKELASSFNGHPKAADVETGFASLAESVLHSLDEELAEALDKAVKAEDADDHAELVQDARGILQRYQDYVTSDGTVAALDANPFVPVAIQKTLSATLTVLSRTLA